MCKIFLENSLRFSASTKSGISFYSKEGINIMKGYMESGEFGRGKESIRADGSLPAEMRDDTAWMDPIHCCLSCWDVPEMNFGLTTDHFGLISDFFSECLSRLRSQSRVSVMQGRVHLGAALRRRDVNAVNKTVFGLLKLIGP